MGRLIRLGLVLFCMSLSSCGAIEFFIEDRVPVLTEFDGGHRGATAQLRFVGSPKNPSSFCLVFEGPWLVKFDQERHARVLGDGGYDTITHKMVNNGVSAQFRLQVTEEDGDLIVDELVNQGEIWSGGFGRTTKILTSKSLERKTYIARLKAIKDTPEYEGLTVHFQVGGTRHW